MKFRNLALMTTSLVALGLSVAPVSAKTAPMMGRVDVDFSYWWDSWDYGGGSTYDDEYTTLVGSARVNIPYDEFVNLQLDITGETSLDEYTGSDAGHFAAGGHLNWRDPMVGLLGVFAAVGTVNDYYAESTAMVGIEGQYYCDMWTFYGQIGYWDSHDGGESSLIRNAGFIRGEVSYYASQQLKLTGGLKYLAGDIGDYYYSAEGSQGWDWILRLDYFFGKTIPVAGFAEYSGRSNDVDYYDNSLDVNRFNVGLTFYFGGDGNNDLKYHDRNGASVSLPDFDEIRSAYRSLARKRFRRLR